MYHVRQPAVRMSCVRCTAKGSKGVRRARVRACKDRSTMNRTEQKRCTAKRQEKKASRQARSPAFSPRARLLYHIFLSKAVAAFPHKGSARRAQLAFPAPTTTPPRCPPRTTPAPEHGRSDRRCTGIVRQVYAHVNNEQQRPENAHSYT